MMMMIAQRIIALSAILAAINLINGFKYLSRIHVPIRSNGGRFDFLSPLATNEKDSTFRRGCYLYDQSKRNCKIKVLGGNILKSSNRLSLDRTILPRSASFIFRIIDYFSGLNGLLYFLLVTIFASGVIQMLLSFLLSFGGNNDASRLSVIGKVKNGIIEVFQKLLGSSLKNEKVAAADLSTWNVCLIEDRVSLNGEYSLYTLELPNSKVESPPLALGQELLLCVVDSRNRVLKESCFPFSWSGNKFQIALKDPPLSKSMSLKEKFASALQQLSPQDELAVKAGKRQLSYRGPEKDIDNVAMIISGMGITSALQILQQVLRSVDANGVGAETAFELLWINERKTDFFLSEQIEELEAQFPEQLFVARVIDPAFGDPESQISEQVKAAVSQRSAGKVALILVPEKYAPKATAFMESLGYGDSSITGVTIEE